VVNRGCKAADAKWKAALGKACFVELPDPGYLKVSFFGPFYGSCIVVERDADDAIAWSAGRTNLACGCSRARRQWPLQRQSGWSQTPRRSVSIPAN
jgi:lipocalin